MKYISISLLLMAGHIAYTMQEGTFETTQHYKRSTIRTTNIGTDRLAIHTFNKNNNEKTITTVKLTADRQITATTTTYKTAPNGTVRSINKTPNANRVKQLRKRLKKFDNQCSFISGKK